MKITDIKPVGKQKVYDISVEDVEHYVLKNGVVTHNTGIYLSADNIYIIGRQQEKDGTELSGYNFIINVEKSRHVREKSKIPVQVKFEGGLSKWSGLLDMAVESGCVIKPSNGWYSRVDDDGVVEEKKWRAKETDCSEFWGSVLVGKNFPQWISDNYKVSTNKLMSDDSTDQSLDDLEDDAE